VKKIWRGDDYRGMHGTLLKLMLNFEMCYKIQGVERYLIPQNQPPCPIDIAEHATATRVLFRYAFLPKGFLTRLICRQHTRIAEPNVWNNAVIFGDTAAATVWAYETYETNTIELIADGHGKAQLLNETIHQLDAIHTQSKFANLEVEKLVPCPCRTCAKKDKPYYFNYDYLQRKLLKAQYKAECQTSLDDVPIRDILKDIRPFSFQQIRDWIAADKIENALNLLRGRYDKDNDVILLMSRLAILEGQRIKGINDKEDERVAYNQLVDNVLGLLQKLEKEE
jgi:internalin A